MAVLGFKNPPPVNGNDGVRYLLPCPVPAPAHSLRTSGFPPRSQPLQRALTFVGQHITPYHSITSICFVTSLTFITLLTSINIIQQFSPPPHSPRAASTQPKSNRLSHTDPHTGLQRRSTDSSDPAAVAVAVAGQPRRYLVVSNSEPRSLKEPLSKKMATVRS